MFIDDVGLISFLFIFALCFFNLKEYYNLCSIIIVRFSVWNLYANLTTCLTVEVIFYVYYLYTPTLRLRFLKDIFSCLQIYQTVIFLYSCSAQSFIIISLMLWSVNQESLISYHILKWPLEPWPSHDRRPLTLGAWLEKQLNM